MPLLFMIAGYVYGIKGYSSEERSIASVFRKNFVSIYLPCIIFSLTDWVLKHFVFKSYDPQTVADSMGFTGLITAGLGGLRKYWFLSVLFFVKMLHAVLERKRLNSVFWIIALIVSVCFSDDLPLFVRRLADGGFFFHAGYIVKRRDYITSEKCPSLVWGILLFVAGAILSRTVGICRTPLAVPLSALCSCLGMFTAFYSLKISHPVFAVSGLYSMVIYCLHNYANAFLNVIHLPRLMPFPVGLYFMYAAAGICLPFLVVVLYKNVKPLRWAEYLFYPGRLFSKL